jgi:translation elongation factor EF-Ts
MGFGDKFKDLAKQAQDTLSEHKDQIHEAVDAASVAADEKTHGKYTDKIAKIGQKASEAVEKASGSDAAAGEDPPATPGEDPAAPPAAE